MTKNLTIKSFAKKDLEELSRVKTGDTVLSFYLGIRPEVNFKSEANSLAAGKIKEVKGNKAYSKAAKKKMIGMIGEIKEEIDLLRSPDEARTIIVFAGIEPGKRLYRFPAYISSRFVIERDPYIHPALVAMENFPRYLAVIVERDKAVFMNIFSGEIEGEPEVVSSDVPKRIRTSASDDWKGRREMRIERHIEDHLSWHLKKISARLTDLLLKDGFDFFVVGIHKEIEKRFAEMLDSRVRDKVIGFWSPSAHYDIKEIKAKSFEVISSHERKAEESAVREVFDGTNEKNWRAVLGIDSVLEHLYLHNIRSFILSRDYKQPGYFCPNCHYISTYLKICPMCKSKMTKVSDLADEILQEAVKKKINVRHLLDPHKDFDRFGIGALLKTPAA